MLFIKGNFQVNFIKETKQEKQKITYLNDSTDRRLHTHTYILSGADLEGGPRLPDPHPPLKFEKCTFYLECLGVFLQIYLGIFHYILVPFFILDPSPPPSEKLDPPNHTYTKEN